jgi:hypothetical protein
VFPSFLCLALHSFRSFFFLFVLSGTTVLFLLYQ